MLSYTFQDLRQRNTCCSTEKVKHSVDNNEATLVKRKKDPLPIEVDVIDGDSEVPETKVEKQSYSADWLRTTKSGKKVYRRVDKRIEPYRVYKDPGPDPRKYQELDLNNCDVESPRGFAEVLTGKEVYEEYPEFQYLDAMMPPVPDPEDETKPEKPPTRFSK